MHFIILGILSARVVAITNGKGAVLTINRFSQKNISHGRLALNVNVEEYTQDLNKSSILPEPVCPKMTILGTGKGSSSLDGATTCPNKPPIKSG